MWQAIVTFILGLLNRWFTQKPEVTLERDYQKRHDQWAKTLKELEDAEEKAHQAWLQKLHRGGDSRDLLLLHDQWVRASKATGNHRRLQPRRPVYGTQ